MNDLTRIRPPQTVTLGVALLWGAWSVTAIDLGINHLAFHGAGIGPGPALGTIALAVQGVVFHQVSRGKSWARVVVVAFLVLAILPLPIINRLAVEGDWWSIAYLASSFSFKALATVLLFSAESRRWYS